MALEPRQSSMGQDNQALPEFVGPALRQRRHRRTSIIPYICGAVIHLRDTKGSNKSQIVDYLKSETLIDDRDLTAFEKGLKAAVKYNMLAKTEDGKYRLVHGDCQTIGNLVNRKIMEGACCKRGKRTGCCRTRRKSKGKCRNKCRRPCRPKCGKRRKKPTCKRRRKPSCKRRRRKPSCERKKRRCAKMWAPKRCRAKNRRYRRDSDEQSEDEHVTLGKPVFNESTNEFEGYVKDSLYQDNEDDTTHFELQDDLYSS